jgi:simple sugar transport system ATP-binding protein
VVAADPTRGLDIGATWFVHEQLRAAAAGGAAILLISTDLDEVLQLSDRIGVLYEGSLLPDENLLPAGISREVIGSLMGGQRLRMEN